MTVVVSDTSPIWALAFLGLLELLHEIYVCVSVPPQVAVELREGRSLPRVDAADFDYFLVQSVTNEQRVLILEQYLDPGEAEAIALAEEIGAERLLMDERDGRAVAISLGLSVIGTLGILAEAKRRGLIPEIAPLLRRLREENRFRLSESLVRDVLSEAGESNEDLEQAK